jgi:hypothetical protein
MDTSTKIVGGLSEFKTEKTIGKSILQRIEECQNETEVNYLLDLGKSYKKASVKTMKMWVKAADKKVESFKV